MCSIKQPITQFPKPTFVQQESIMTQKDDIFENYEADMRAADLARSLEREAEKRAAGDPTRLALDARLDEMAREWAIAEGLADLPPLEDRVGCNLSIAAE